MFMQSSIRLERRRKSDGLIVDVIQFGRAMRILYFVLDTLCRIFSCIIITSLLGLIVPDPSCPCTKTMLK
jgi:hypothetical protein